MAAKTKSELFADALEEVAKNLKKYEGYGPKAAAYLLTLVAWYNAPETQDSGSNPGGGNPPPPPPGGHP